jgi:hypothetical protein
MLWLMQRTLIFLAVVLCAAQPSECDPGMYSAPMPGQQTTTYPTAEPARPSSPNPEIILFELPEAEAWPAVKSTVGLGVLVLQPTVVPGRFTGVPVMIEYAYIAGSDVRYRVGYRAVDGLINVAAGAVNSAAPTSTETITLRGLSAQYSSTSSWPELQITWTEGNVVYSIQARGISKAELIQIATGLVAVP